MRRIGRYALAAVVIAAPVAAQQTLGVAAAGEQVRAQLATAAHGAEPRLDNKGAALVRAAFDADAIRAMGTDLDALGDACVSVGNTMVAYAEFAGRVAKQPGVPDADTVTIGLQNEVTLAGIAGNVCVQRMFRAALVTAQSFSPERRAGARDALKQMRDGAVQTITGTIGIAADPGINAINRQKMMTAILEDPAAVAASFPAAERASLRGEVLAIPPAGNMGPAIQQLAAALARTECNLLCQIASGE